MREIEEETESERKLSVEREEGEAGGRRVVWRHVKDDSSSEEDIKRKGKGRRKKKNYCDKVVGAP